MINKNDEFELAIGSMGSEGEGIGHTGDGMTVFVPDAIPGDIIRVHVVKVKKTYAYGIVAEILKPSPHRVPAVCPVASKCGGCTIQHMSYDEQLRCKETKVRDCLIRIGGVADPPMEPITGATRLWNYRNKAQFPVGTDRNGKPVAGFYRRHSHDVVNNPDCCIQAEINSVIVRTILEFMEARKISAYNEETGRGLVRHIFTRVGFATGEVIVCLVINEDGLKDASELAALLKDAVSAEGLVLAGFCLNINKKNTNVILGDKVKCVLGRPYIEDLIGDVRYRISPLSFYQVNPEQTLKLYETALEFAGLTGSEVVWDLYCGIGTISLFLARKAKEVYGVEIVPEAIGDAKENARINGIENAHFQAGAAEDLAPSLPRPDVIVVDPPRKGCDPALLETILANAPERVVYVSCDPATLARDVKILLAGGYTLTRVRPVDQFIHDGHVESCVLLQRVESHYAGC